MTSVPSLLHAATPYVLPEVWRISTKFAFFGGTAVAIGAATVHVAVLRPALRDPSTTSADRAVLRAWSAFILAGAGLILLAAIYPQLAGKVARAGDGMPFGDAFAPSAVWTYLQTPAKAGEWVSSGTLVFIQFASFAAFSLLMVLLVFEPIRRHVDVISGVAFVGLVAANLALLVPTDPSKQTPTTVASHIMSVIHPLSGCLWVGGLVILAALSGARRRLSPSAGTVWSLIWKRFSIVAEVAVGLVLVSGLLLGWEALSSVSQLWETTYGRILLLKVVLVFALIAIGAVNEFVLLPRISRLRSEGDDRSLFALVLHHFPKMVVVEAAIGVAVLAVMPFLNGSAREETGGEADPVPTGGIFAAVALLLLFGIVGFVASARYHRGVEEKLEPAALLTR